MAEIAFGLRRGGMGLRRAGVELSYTDGPHGSGSVRGSRLLCRDDEILGLALAALERARKRRVRIRRIRLELSDLASAGPELDLFEPEDLRLTRLQAALDKVRGKFGPTAIAPCALFALGG